MTGPFTTYTLPEAQTSFEELRASIRFEDVANGRKGAVLLAPVEQLGVPIVRTTTRYVEPAQCYGALHRHIAEQIKTVAALEHSLNNALAELYSNTYAKMGFHCDQAIDLEPCSNIAILSRYRYPDRGDSVRRLVVESKSGGQRFDIQLHHNTVVVFSLATNQQFRHKIVLDRSRNPLENEWLGLTFRTSNTFVHYGDTARFSDGQPMTLANETEEQDFFQLRARENRESHFVYPRLTYTISPSDLEPPIPTASRGAGAPSA